jgi:hypothetical protein
MPEWKDEIKNRLAGLNLAPAREAEIVEELAQHLEIAPRSCCPAARRRKRPRVWRSLS